MEHKSHKKLYKSGKLWVAATIATSAMAGMALSQNVAHADTLNLTPVEKTADTQLPPVPETSYAKAAQQNVENTPATVGTPQPTFNAPSAQAAQPAKDTLPVDAVEGLSAQELQELHDRQSQPEVQATNATTTNQVADVSQPAKDTLPVDAVEGLSAQELQELHDRQSQPEVQVADATNKGQVTVAKAVKSATTKQAVSAVKAQPARAAQAKALPQTGNDSANASVLGLAGVAMLSMIGLAAKCKF